MLFVLSTIGLLYVTLASDPAQVLDDYHLAWSLIPAVCGVVVGVVSLTVSSLPGWVPFAAGWGERLAVLVAGPAGTPWWYYAASTVVLYVVYSVTKHNEVQAVRELRGGVDDARAELDDIHARIEDGAVAEAEEALADLEPRLRAMGRTALEHELAELRGEISTLQQKRRTLLADVADQAESSE